MLSSVLRSKRAVQANIEIMRTFVKLRVMLTSHREFAQRLNAKCSLHYIEIYHKLYGRDNHLCFQREILIIVCIEIYSPPSYT